MAKCRKYYGQFQEKGGRTYSKSTILLELRSGGQSTRGVPSVTGTNASCPKKISRSSWTKHEGLDTQSYLTGKDDIPCPAGLGIKHWSNQKRSIYGARCRTEGNPETNISTKIERILRIKWEGSRSPRKLRVCREARWKITTYQQIPGVINGFYWL